MWTDRFAKLQILDFCEEDEKVIVKTLRILPGAITGYNHMDISYEDEMGLTVKSQGVEVFAKEDMYTVALHIDDFERIMNEKYQ